jgi:hypothetical protein
MTCGGTTYHDQSVGRPNIVMTERNGGWICLTAKLPADRLMDLALKLESEILRKRVTVEHRQDRHCLPRAMRCGVPSLGGRPAEAIHISQSF